MVYWLQRQQTNNVRTKAIEWCTGWKENKHIMKGQSQWSDVLPGNITNIHCKDKSKGVVYWLRWPRQWNDLTHEMLESSSALNQQWQKVSYTVFLYFMNLKINCCFFRYNKLCSKSTVCMGNTSKETNSEAILNNSFALEYNTVDNCSSVW